MPFTKIPAKFTYSDNVGDTFTLTRTADSVVLFDGHGAGIIDIPKEETDDFCAWLKGEYEE